MTAVERLEALKTVDIKEIDRDSLPKYKDLISELDSRKSNKMEVLLNHSDKGYQDSTRRKQTLLVWWVIILWRLWK